MRTFKGSSREWKIQLNFASARRVKDLLGFNLLEPNKLHEGVPLLSYLYTDMMSFVDVLYVVCKPQADAAEISDVQFGSELCDEEEQRNIYLEARDAFFDEVIDFFHRSGHQETAASAQVQLKSMMAAQAEIWDQAQTVDVETPSREKIKNTNMNEMVSKAIAGVKSTSLPESLESFPTS